MPQWLLMGLGIAAALFIVGGLLRLITEPSAEAFFAFGFGVLGLVVTIALSSTEAADSNGLTSTPGQHFTATPVETPFLSRRPRHRLPKYRQRLQSCNRFGVGMVP